MNDLSRVDRTLSQKVLTDYGQENVLILLENKLSEPSGQNTFAESELKCRLSMDRKMYSFLLGNQ